MDSIGLFVGWIVSVFLATLVGSYIGAELSQRKTRNAMQSAATKLHTATDKVRAAHELLHHVAGR